MPRGGTVLIFVDESGLPHPNDPNPYPVIAAVAVQESTSKDFSREVFNLKKKFWGVTDPTQWEIKGTKLLSRRAFTCPKKIEFVEEILSLCRKMGLAAFASIMKRPVELSLSLTSKESAHLSKMYQFLLERIDYFVRVRTPDGFGILLFDA